MRYIQIRKVFNSIASFLQNNLFLFLIFILYILFHSFFENIISVGIVNPVASTLQPNIINDIIFIIIALFILVRCIISIINNYSISPRYILVSVFLVLIISYYRLSENPWIFTSTHIMGKIKYIDVLLLFFISNIIIKLFHRQKKYISDPKKGFSFDNPIKSKNGDTLNRNPVSENLVKKIVNTANNEDAFTIGINSEWGYGKTSFINLIETNIKEEKGKRIIIHFNPWLNNDEKSIVYSFFKELSSNLKKYNKELSNDILKYSKLLNSIQSNSFINFSNEILSLGNDKNSNLLQQFNSINKNIKHAGLQIVIFIDDLDRLYDNEILEVLKLIRNSASFANTVFVVAYDRSYLISALKKTNNYKPHYYLEKIFQIELSLPAFERDVIENKLKELIDFHISDEEDKQELHYIIEQSKDIGIRTRFRGNYFNIDLLTNLRDVYRFFNSFIISYKALKKEIVLLDLLNIESLRLKYPGVYNHLAKNCNYNNYLTSYTFQASKSFLSLLKITDNKGNETGKTVLQDYLEHNYFDVGIEENQINDVINCVYSIFPHYDYLHELKENILSINYSASVGKYFHYALLKTNLSEVEFSKSRLKNTNEFKKDISDWVTKGLYSEVEKRLENIELFSDKEDYEKIIDAVLYYSELPHPKEENRLMRFDHHCLYDKFNYNKVSAFYSEEEFREYIIVLLKSHLKPYNIIYNLISLIFDIEGVNHWNFILTKEDLLKLKLDYFKNYVDSIKRFDAEFIRLFHYCDYKEWVNTSGNHYNQINQSPKEAKDIFIELASGQPESFIQNIIAKNYPFPDNDKYPSKYSILFETVLKAWGNWNNFEEFIDSFDENHIKGLSEFKKFYNICKENSYNYIEFDFKEIDLSTAALLSN